MHSSGNRNPTKNGGGHNAHMVTNVKLLLADAC